LLESTTTLEGVVGFDATGALAAGCGAAATSGGPLYAGSKFEHMVLRTLPACSSAVRLEPLTISLQRCASRVPRLMLSSILSGSLLARAAKSLGRPALV